jgi:hypothetical protein
MAQENQEKLELNETYNFLVCVDNVNLLGESINTINRNTEALLEARREGGPEVNTENEVYGSVSPPEFRTKS